MTDADVLHIEFSVRDNESGCISSDLAVEYDGPASSIIKSWVADLERAHDAVAPREVLTEVLIDLPEDTPVTSVRLRDSGLDDR